MHQMSACYGCPKSEFSGIPMNSRSQTLGFMVFVDSVKRFKLFLCFGCVLLDMMPFPTFNNVKGGISFKSKHPMYKKSMR